MRTILIVVAAMLAVYLYVDKFLFRGELAGLFFRGWRELLHSLWQGAIRLLRLSNKESSNTLSEPTTQAQEFVDDGLVLQKRYSQCPTVTEGATTEKSASDGSTNDTFTSATEAHEAEVLEWRSPLFPISGSGKSGSALWEEQRFGAHFIQRDDQSGEVELIERIDAEQLRREVAASLEQVRDDELRDEFLPSEQERSSIEHFEAEAYL